MKSYPACWWWWRSYRTKPTVASSTRCRVLRRGGTPHAHLVRATGSDTLRIARVVSAISLFLLELFAEGGRAADRRAAAAAVSPTVQAETVPLTNLVCAKLVQLVEVEITRFVAKLEEGFEARGGGRCELDSAREDCRSLRRRGRGAEVRQDVCISTTKKQRSVLD